MKKFAYSCVLLALAAASARAAIDGTVLNRTSGHPASGISITLLKPGAQGPQGMPLPRPAEKT
jgi:5-hydroxyisourate hydrolase-like protein (transthyretin family)